MQNSKPPIIILAIICALICIVYAVSGEIPGENISDILPEDTLEPEPVNDSEDIGGDSGWFQITSKPYGARVFFDGSEIGSTPTKVEVFSTGTPEHTVEIELAGYEKWTETYHENPGPGETITVYADLIPENCCADLQITSAPSGAQIALNGKFMGYTPKSMENLVPGLYEVTLSRKGYETWHRSLMVSPDKDNSYYIVMEPLFAPITSATLMVVSYPAGAEIILDQTVRGKTPRSLTLSEGPHSLTLNLTGYNPYSTSVYLRNMEQSRIDTTLVPVSSGKTPIIAATTKTQKILSIHDLQILGDTAAGTLQRTGIEAFIQEVNNPDSPLHQNGAYITVLAENGTLLADPMAPSMTGVNITNLTDRNMVPFGMAQKALAQHGGGELYESDIANTSPDGGVIISTVRPVTDGYIIAVSYPLPISLPVITPQEISSLISGLEPSSNQERDQMNEVMIPVPPDDTISEDETENQTLLNQEDTYGLTSLPVLHAVSKQDGGFCYISDPDKKEDITLAYISPVTESTAVMRWFSGRVNHETVNYETVTS